MLHDVFLTAQRLTLWEKQRLQGLGAGCLQDPCDSLHNLCGSRPPRPPPTLFPTHTSPVNPPWVIPFQVCLPDWTLPNTMKNLEVRERTVQRTWDEKVLGIVKEQGPSAGVSKEVRDRRWNQTIHREEEQMEKHFWNLGFYSASGGSHWRTLSRGITWSDLYGTERTLACKETEGVRVVAGRAVRRSQQ